MKVVTSLQMQKIGREAILKFGIPSIELMENAGRKVSEVAIKMVQASSSVCVCCGGGNNGGINITLTGNTLYTTSQQAKQLGDAMARQINAQLKLRSW